MSTASGTAVADSQTCRYDWGRNGCSAPLIIRAAIRARQARVMTGIMPNGRTSLEGYDCRAADERQRRSPVELARELPPGAACR